MDQDDQTFGQNDTEIKDKDQKGGQVGNEGPDAPEQTGEEDEMPDSKRDQGSDNF